MYIASRVCLGIITLVFTYCPQACAKGTPDDFAYAVDDSTVKTAFPLEGGWCAKVQHDTSLTIYDRKGNCIATNTHLLRGRDQERTCPAEGFRQISTKGFYFTIEQQTCSGWLFIDEYLTFRYNPKGTARDIVLWKYGMSFTDRRNPDKVIRDKIFSQKATRAIRFQDVRIEQLHARLYRSK